MIGLIDKAIIFALRAHSGQQRKTGREIPFIAHPFGVAMLLQGMGCAENVVVAGLLHDTVEDTPVTLADIEAEFGPEVARIVSYCTEPHGRWETRKQVLIDNLRHAPLEAKLLAAADKYHNLSHMLHNLEKYGPTMWRNFSRGAEQQAWYYRSVLDSILQDVAEPDQYPIFGQLQGVIEQLFMGVATCHVQTPSP